ncbi:MAG: transglutaminase domain-containing protein, partial [Candidatus Roizmanbacteria bacterium]
MVRRLLSIFLLFFVYALVTQPVRAEVYELSYTVTYTLSDSDTTDVDLDVHINNPRPDLYVQKFSLSVPAVFDISDISATSPQSDVDFGKELQNDTYLLSFQFRDPDVGKNSQNDLHISYKQKGLSRITPHTIEAILPTLVGKATKDVTVIVKKAPSMQKTLTIAKPRPTENNVTYMTWEHVTTPSLYVLFGEYQLYDVQLNYSLKNPRFTPASIDVAFPPETLYQSIYIKDLSVKPNSVYIDPDGNYMARYNLGPREEKEIQYKGTIKVFAKPQDDMLSVIRSQFQNQQAYLLQTQNLWDISSIIDRPEFKQLKTARDIYSYIIDTFDYSYARVNSAQSERFGALKAFSQPSNAVCLEYADAFVALAREKGLSAREAREIYPVLWTL